MVKLCLYLYCALDFGIIGASLFQYSLFLSLKEKGIALSILSRDY
jgi:hypothetical protein